MAKRLNNMLNRDVVNAIRIIRTECCRVFSQTRKDRLDRTQGLNMTKEWITAQDEPVRSSHEAMNGVTIPYNDDFMLPSGKAGFAPGLIGSASEDIIVV